MNAVCLTIGNMPGLPQELIENDVRSSGSTWILKCCVRASDRTLQRVNAHIAWLAEVLADGSQFIFGTDPSAADLSVYHPIWFARRMVAAK